MVKPEQTTEPMTWSWVQEAHWCTWGPKVSMSGPVPQKTTVAQIAVKLNADCNGNMSEHITVGAQITERSTALQVLKDQLLTYMCQIPPHTFSCLDRSKLFWQKEIYAKLLRSFSCSDCLVCGYLSRVVLFFIFRGAILSLWLNLALFLNSCCLHATISAVNFVAWH